MVALRSPGEAHFSYSPQSDTVVVAGAVIIVIGERARVARVEAVAR